LGFSFACLTFPSLTPPARTKLPNNDADTEDNDDDMEDIETSDNIKGAFFYVGDTACLTEKAAEEAIQQGKVDHLSLFVHYENPNVATSELCAPWLEIVADGKEAFLRTFLTRSSKGFRNTGANVGCRELQKYLDNDNLMAPFRPERPLTGPQRLAKTNELLKIAATSDADGNPPEPKTIAGDEQTYASSLVVDRELWDPDFQETQQTTAPFYDESAMELDPDLADDDSHTTYQSD
jgi:hypothetical protein